MIQIPNRLLLSFLFFCSLIVSLWWGQVPLFAQYPKATDLVYQGVEYYQQGNYTKAISAWKQALNLQDTQNNIKSQALIHENIARAYQTIGKTEQEIDSWEKAINNYQQIQDIRQLGRLLTEQAQAYSRLGQQEKAITRLCNNLIDSTELSCSEQSAISIAKNYQDLEGEIAALGSLGEAYRLMGKYETAIRILEKEALSQIENLENSTYHAAILNSLGNVYLAQALRWQTQADSALVRNANNTADNFKYNADQASRLALSSYQKALRITRRTENLAEELQTLIKLIRFSQQFPALNSIETLYKEALALLQKVPNSSRKIYSAINLAITSPLNQCPLNNSLPNSQIKITLEQAAENASSLQNSRTESFALGSLGHYYECQKQYEKALEYTESALWLAEQNRVANDSLYLWEWQKGRIIEKQGQKQQAITVYERAYNTLETIRSDILTSNRDFQFDFRDTIEPLYRQLIQLVLEQDVQPSHKLSQPIIKGLQILNSLKIAELQNYLGNDCIFTTNTNANEIRQTLSSQISDRLENIRNDTAIVIPILFQHRIGVVLSLPKQEIRVNWIDKEKENLTTDLEIFWKDLQSFYDLTETYKSSSKKLYDLLLQPFETDLNPAKIKNLVFILDGSLRNIPMAALYDGQQYLIEKYAISTVPSITLIEPSVVDHINSSILAMGVAEASNIEDELYTALPNVKSELKQIQATFPNSKQLLNQEFTRENLQQQFQQKAYPIIHIATHGKFGTIPEDSFLVLGNSTKLTITELEEDIRRFNQNSDLLKLLTLTACQTAVGDDRTTLGLAGISIQAGVKSTLASLWYISDAYTESLMTEFYNNLKMGMGKAEALQQAQIVLIKQGTHPAIWSPFVLIGNWL